ncbi:MAG: chorismate synthase [Eubacteriales bacterium]
MWGNKFKISIFGESHGEGVGVIVDGLPAGLKLSEENILRDMRRRAPGSIAGSTKRSESDVPHILSGYYDGFTTGSPLAAYIKNADQHSNDYADLEGRPRPSHADYTAWVKYGGFADMRGGGHFSGRLTAPLVFAGSVARAYLEENGIYVGSHILRVGEVEDKGFDTLNLNEEVLKSLYRKDFPTIDEDAAKKMKEQIDNARNSKNSVGGIVEIGCVNLPAGIGEPIFDGLEPKIASILFAVPAVKGIEFGLGFKLSSMHGSDANDQMCISGEEVSFKSNNNGGILGGISSGAPLIVRAAFKPTPSISAPQSTVDLVDMKDIKIEIKGRHDSCIAVRGAAAAEAAVLIAIADAVMESEIF